MNGVSHQHDMGSNAKDLWVRCLCGDEQMADKVRDGFSHGPPPSTLLHKLCGASRQLLTQVFFLLPSDSLLTLCFLS